MRALGLGVLLILAAGAAALLLGRRPRAADRLFSGLLVAGCGILVFPALSALAGTEAMSTLAGSLPGGPWVFGLDPLSAWFLLAVLAVGAAAGVFGPAYLAQERPHHNVAAAHGLVAVLLVAMIGVVTARSVMPFLVAWEVMALSAYFLVVFEREQEEVRQAGLIYIVLTHLSTLALVGLFAALSAWSGGASFADFLAGGVLAGKEQTLVFGFALAGFGLKAGAVPLHFWLPGAHAAAPSHVSALLSGVMLKMGIYGLLRVLTLVGAGPLWFGWTLLVLGLVSGVLGVLWALGQHDLKRLLAYHSVENIGIILLGMGVGVLGVAYQHPLVALLGFTGAVLHSLNHALFKSLLFLGAGVVVRATGTRVIERLGGLGRRLPWTALAFGVGSAAIVGLPPFNGFVSEWTVFRGLLTAGESRLPLRFLVLGAPALALIGGLALACFSKLDGVVFLGETRDPESRRPLARDAEALMTAPMIALAAACLAIGLWPGPALGAARLVAGEVMHLGGEPPPGGADWAGAPAGVALVGLVLLLVSLGLGGIRLRLRSARQPRRSETWACAGIGLIPRMQYSASSYAAPILARFGTLSGVRETRGVTAFHSHPLDLVLDRAVLPAWRVLGDTSRRLRGWQGARIRWYLLSVVTTLLALIYYLLRWKGGP